MNTTKTSRGCQKDISLPKLKFDAIVMTTHTDIKLFEEKRVRTAWDDVQEKWFFSIVDIVAILTDSADPKQYLKKIKMRDPEIHSNWGTICTLVQITSSDGKKRKEMTSDLQGVFRIIQSIPSPKAEPFKKWMAQVAAERIDQMQDPELSIQQAMTDYRRLGYSENWINQRLKSIEVRKELTDEWKRRGLKEGTEFATLTDIIYQAWSDMTAKEYKRFKGLKGENLRDNMTNKELVLNMLAEISTKEISETRNPNSFGEHMDIAEEGGEIARNARIELEAKTGKAIISPLNAKDGLLLNQSTKKE